MAAGLPFVASYFPHWKSIVENNNCGICIEPTNSEAVHDACNYLLENPDIAQEMCRSGYYAVIAKYNWKNEEEQLLWLYEGL